MSVLMQTMSKPNTESTMRDWVTMTKPGVLLLVVFSGMTGMILSPVQLHPFVQFITVLCIAMGSAAGAIFNMVYDQDIDAIMKRTQKRPLIKGSINPDDALIFGIFLTLMAVGILGIATNWFAAALLAFAIFFYAVIYTIWLKRATPQNIVIGGAAGAFPPVIGWLAMTGSTPVLPWVLFAIVFFWTPPHFWALALFRNEDYTRANVPMLPVVSGAHATSKQMLLYALALLPLCLLPIMLSDKIGFAYGVVATLLNLRFIHFAWKVHQTHDDGLARKMFGFSILYLLLIFAAMIVDATLI